jgi:hypothetical protein
MIRPIALTLFAACILTGVPAFAEDASDGKESKVAASKTKTETHPQVQEQSKNEEQGKKPAEKAVESKSQAPAAPAKAPVAQAKAPAAQAKPPAEKAKDPLPPPTHVRTRHPGAAPPSASLIESHRSGAVVRSPASLPAQVRRPLVWERDWDQTPKVEWEGSSPLVEAARLELGPHSEAAVQKVSDDLNELKRTVAELTELVKSMAAQQK